MKYYKFIGDFGMALEYSGSSGMEPIPENGDIHKETDLFDGTSVRSWVIDQKIEGFNHWIEVSEMEYREFKIAHGDFEPESDKEYIVRKALEVLGQADVISPQDLKWIKTKLTAEV